MRGCILDGNVWVSCPGSGLTRPRLSWTEHLQSSKEAIPPGVRATNVQTREVMTNHLCNYGFTRNYTRWTYHGEANRMRDEVVRQRIEEHDADAGVADMLDDFHEAHFDE